MIILDTHAWIWWRDDPERLSERARERIATEDVLGVSAISCAEVAYLVHRGRIRLDRSLDAWSSAALGSGGARGLPVTPEIGFEAGSLPDAFPRDPADRIIYATARSTGSVLITADNAIRAFDPRLTIW